MINIPVGPVLIVLALLPLSHGAQQLNKLQPFLDRSETATGTVVDVEWLDDHGRPTTSLPYRAYPVLGFASMDGQRHSARLNVGQYPAAHAIGDQIPIRYDPARLDDVREDGLTGLYLEPLIYLIPGALTLAAGLWLTLAARRKVNRLAS